MQTFVPMIEYRAALESLDGARLNKQILEVTQLVNAIMDPSVGYQHHPAKVMWEYNVLNLLSYGIVAVETWATRARKSPAERAAPLYARQVAIAQHLGPRGSAAAHAHPLWVGDLDVHESHRSNLIRKNPDHYDSWPGTPELMPYLWPRITGKDEYRIYLSQADIKRLATGERVLPEYLRVMSDGEVVSEDDEGSPTN